MAIPMRLLNKQISIQRRTKASDGQGGYRTDWKTVQEGIPARIVPLTLQETVEYEKLKFKVSHRIFCSGAITVKEDDRVVFGTRSFDVRGVINPSEIGHHLELICGEERKGTAKG